MSGILKSWCPYSLAKGNKRDLKKVSQIGQVGDLQDDAPSLNLEKNHWEQVETPGTTKLIRKRSKHL